MSKQRVVAAVGNDEAARAVLLVAAKMAETRAARVEAIHVLEDDPTRAAAAAQAAEVAFRIRRGPTVAALIAASEEEDVCALVLGTSSTRTDNRPIGHIAAQVIAAVRKPVLMVPADSPYPVRVKSLLVPLDATASTSAALGSTIEWARAADVEVHLLHVHEDSAMPFFDDQPHHEASAWKREFAQRNSPRADEVRLEVRTGQPKDAVLALTAEISADIIALAWNQDLSPDRARLVRPVLAQSPVPVLLVPTSPRETETVSTGTRRSTAERDR